MTHLNHPTSSNFSDKSIIDVKLAIVQRFIDSIEYQFVRIDDLTSKATELESIEEYSIHIHARKILEVLACLKTIYENIIGYSQNLKDQLSRKLTIDEYNNSVEAKNFEQLVEFYNNNFDFIESFPNNTKNLVLSLLIELKSLLYKKIGERIKSYRYISELSKELGASLEMAKKQSDTFFLSLS